MKKLKIFLAALVIICISAIYTANCEDAVSAPPAVVVQDATVVDTTAANTAATVSDTATAVQDTTANNNATVTDTASAPAAAQ